VDDLSEKEQLEALRAWWSENGSYVTGGVIVGMLIIFGWNQWQSTKAETEIAASSLFEDVMEGAGRGNLDTAATAAEQLFTDYPDTPYAAQARLAMARMYMDNGRDQDAADVLRSLAERAPGDELALVARLRLARILLYQDKAQEVVDLIKDMPETAFAARFSEVLGDAYVALGSYAEAEAAYVAALNDSPVARTVDPALIQLKMNDLPAPSDTSNEAALPEGEAVSVQEPAAEGAAAGSAGDDAEAMPAEAPATDESGDEESGER